ncbi:MULTISPECIES: hypothetical protein [Streptomyces]|uniref:DUF3298 domain-containing protein n=1 Tax=Streptomyces dengpaensis TaxID=2049881 RepID=A0ABN5I278_9ACTN|nr:MULTISPECIES: hypothetical protein [Streptomyces]AVH56900.1 hypothetical protein C4B68_15155 [Streptomyces dengpaensis]PIB04751.1 hypothetical protein B1C81_31860 [Streptomyces sp. HG99]
MRAHFGRVVLAGAPLCIALAGCSEGSGTGEPADTGRPAVGAAPEVKRERPPAEPRTPEEFLERARRAMASEGGWTFAAKGKEELVLQGRTSAAFYTSTVRRTGDPEALHSTGAIVSKGVGRSEEVFVVREVGYVKEGGAGKVWKKGPVSDPDIADKVEDPVDALEAFTHYAKAGEGAVEVVEADGHVRLQVHTASRRLAEVRDRPAVEKAVRELEPALAQLRKAGIRAGEDQLLLDRVDETLVLDTKTFRITSHRFACSFLIPYQGRTIAYSQDVREETRGVFAGEIRLPAGVS